MKSIELIEVEFIPDHIDDGKFYYSKKYKTSSHLCPCGCGQHFSVPIKDGEWSIQNNNPLTVNPSFFHRIGCRSHYVITEGVITYV